MTDFHSRGIDIVEGMLRLGEPLMMSFAIILNNLGSDYDAVRVLAKFDADYGDVLIHSSSPTLISRSQAVDTVII